MSSLQSLREFISERLAAAAEEIFRHCEGTIVQYEEELCRQRRLLDIIWKPQLQLDAVVLPHHWVNEENEEEDLCNRQKNFTVEQNDPEPPQTEEEQGELEPSPIKEEPEEFFISQDGEELDLKHETDTLMGISTYEEYELSEADLNNQQSFNVTDRKKPFLCKECDKSFSHVSSLKTHMRTHSGEKPFTCTECEKSFSLIFYLKIHMRTHTGEKPYTCKECGKSFSQMSNLKTHMRTHSGEKPFSCKECDRSFSHVCSLKTHMRTHTREKPFTCKECDKSFSYKFGLKKHMRTHTGKKPFSCKDCDKSFSQISSLTTHMRTHTGETL